MHVTTRAPADRPRTSRGRSADPLFRIATAAASCLVLALLAGMVIRTTWAAWPAFRHSGIGFLTGTTWNPNLSKFGALPFIYGTLVTSLIALLLAVPVSVLIALFVTEVAPPRLGTSLGNVVDLLAAVPSVIYGLWGLIVMAPFLAAHVWAPLSRHLGFIPIFAGFAGSSLNFLTAGLILALMITPIISAICREVFRTVPSEEREAALAIGATRWEMIRMAVLPPSRSGVVAAVMLGFGRAVGETIAVAMLIGGFPRITDHLLLPGSSIAANIALQFNEAASTPLFKAALIGLGVILFALTLVVNVAARLIIRRGAAR